MVKTILQYLRNTEDQCLIHGEPDLKHVGYIDPSFQSERGDSKSVLGFVFTLYGGAICWKSSKQAIVVDSVCEAEYLAASDAAIRVVTKVSCRARGGTSLRWLLSSVV